MSNFQLLATTFTIGELKAHDAKVRVDAIDECIKTITNLCGGLPNISIIGALEQLKEQNS